ncbi:MAG TPA: hypothetical protein VFF23_01290 [Hanamia sp.]|nr:hypothetical protein [Hanamia sp.]
MNTVRKIFGVIWILFAITCAYFLIIFGVPRFTSGTQEGIVFGIIILFILMPLTVVGLAVFGYYSVAGEYDENKMIDK